MSEKPHIITRQVGSLGFITLNRAERANAYLDLTLEMIEYALAGHVATAEVRAIVFESAAPGQFCGGADLDELSRRGPTDALNLKSMRLFDNIAACPKPTIAAIDGPAVAGGLELALACDVRLATDRARFAMPETSLGLIPAAGATFRLPRLAGDAVARRMILFGEELNAAQALQCGLVAEVVTPEALAEAVQRWGTRVADLDPLALELAKNALATVSVNDSCRRLTLSSQALLYERRNRQKTGGQHDV
ncbi:MAG: enoyl-CoA hydratase/isomerase family protein [Thermoanaerobaculales bacterium]|nr:enoyl-CoA hydratase/isomerase family protein [Thermoanaerobaculales bacterium]